MRVGKQEEFSRKLKGTFLTKMAVSLERVRVQEFFNKKSVPSDAQLLQKCSVRYPTLHKCLMKCPSLYKYYIELLHKYQDIYIRVLYKRKTFDKNQGLSLLSQQIRDFKGGNFQCILQSKAPFYLYNI